MLPLSLLNLLTPFLSIFNDRYDQPPSSSINHHKPSSPLHFELRQFHAVTSDARVLFHDATTGPHQVAATSSDYLVNTRKLTSHRPPSFEAFSSARTRSLYFGETVPLDWDEDEIEGPDIESRETLLTLAKMTNDAYLNPGEPGWYDLGGDWNVSYPFGWEPDDNGFRGHVFATSDNSTVVLAIKGTSAAFLGGGGPTAKKDKFNDNLLFSCCCARIDWTWTTVCGCYRGGWKCDQNCLEDALVEESLFYPIGTNLYNNITYMYPESNIWVIGHSLGGALATLLSVTFGAPSVAFESPGDKLAATRLHLPLPPSVQHITHVFHTADPIAMGTCNGVLSSCALGGYAMETRCHLGESIVYDTVGNLTWAVDIRTHGIVTVIEQVLAKPWAPSQNIGREVPTPKHDVDCVECFSWDFGDYPAKPSRRKNTSRLVTEFGT